ncbi:MAG: SRPBCC family protein [Pseudomonadota bacterium]
MTHHVIAQRKIAVPADDLWSTIRRMDGIEAWYSDFISASEVPDPDALQPRRNCTMADGGELKERILLRDDVTRTFVYAIDSHPLPARNLVGSIRIDDLGNQTSMVTWGANMTLEDAHAAQMEDMVTEIYAKGLKSLEQYHAR